MGYYEELVDKMTTYYCNQTKCTPDQASDVMIRIRVLADQLAEHCKTAEAAVQNAFPLTAEGEALERHAALRGLTRKAGDKAVGVVSFGRPAPAGYSILIPQGTVVQSGGEEPLRFVTTEDVALPGSFSDIIASVQAVEPGARYNLKKNSITVMVTPPPGITLIRHVTACKGGTDSEGDEALRRRLLDTCRGPAIGGSPGYYRKLALDQTGVGKVKVLPVCRGAGTVDLVVRGSYGALYPADLNRLRELFRGQRELGVDVLVREVQTTPVNLSLTLGVREGWDYDAVRESCEEALQEELEGLDIGEPWLLARMYRCVMSQEGVHNCAVTLPAADVYPLEDRLLVPGGITIQRMEVSV